MAKRGYRKRSDRPRSRRRKKPPLKPGQCANCGEMFETNEELMEHVKTHKEASK